ncbi:MAG: HD domain-containing protein [Clostridiaceae bacterium]|jgi:tRNA nucleotidyltransferase/poly(A) polymerase|nr:HD domain-containing protein [Clostridiaceae bacterium]
MNIFIPTDLKRLAALFPSDKPLYLVGGYVRNWLLGVNGGDFDVASALSVEALHAVAAEHGFSIIPVNPKIGSVLIKNKTFAAEYTSFRVDSYPIGSGAHSPTEVRFTDDIEEDARRRDFTANAIYYDIRKEALVDVLNGAEDVKNGVLRTTDNPERVLSEDGLRIMRMVRLAAETGFAIDRDTFETARRLSPRLKDISAERIRVELEKTLVADLKYPRLHAAKNQKTDTGENATAGSGENLYSGIGGCDGENLYPGGGENLHAGAGRYRDDVFPETGAFFEDLANDEYPSLHERGVRLLCAVGAIEYVIPRLTDGRGVIQNQKYHNYDVYGHTMRALRYAPAEIRLAALLHDIAKPICVQKYGTMLAHPEVGAEITETILSALKFPKAVIKETVRLVRLHMYDLEGNTGTNKLRIFVLENNDILDKLILLKIADAKASSGARSVSAERLIAVRQKMLDEKTPFSLKDLLIDGDDLSAAAVSPQLRSTVLARLLRLALNDASLRTREAQLNRIKSLAAEAEKEMNNAPRPGDKPPV